jgi:tetratricopeptide (TPR) repeat protein
LVYAFSIKAEVLAQMGCFEESLVCYDEAFKINSNNDKVLLSKNSILVTLERYAKGLECLNKF